MSNQTTGRNSAKPAKDPDKKLNPEWVHTGYVLKTMRVRYGYSADKLAQEMLCSRSYIDAIEAGRKPLTDTLVARACAVLPGPKRGEPLKPIAFRWRPEPVTDDAN